MTGLNLTRATTGPPDIKHTCTQTILAMVFLFVLGDEDKVHGPTGAIMDQV